MKQEYNALLKSGMFFEFYPSLTGDWDKDKKEFTRQLKKTRKSFLRLKNQHT